MYTVNGAVVAAAARSIDVDASASTTTVQSFDAVQTLEEFKEFYRSKWHVLLKSGDEK